MTNAFREERVIKEYRFVVPCSEPFGGTWDDFGAAQSWALDKAQELGINTTWDDWSTLHVEDDRLVIVLVDKK